MWRAADTETAGWTLRDTYATAYQPLTSHEAAGRRSSNGRQGAGRRVRPPGQSTRRGLSSPSLRGITSTTWSIDRGTCPSSLSSWRRGCHLRPSRPRRSKSTSSTRSDIVQVRAEVLVRLPGVAVGAVALPEARKHVPVADAAVGAHPLQHNLLVQDSPCATFGGIARDLQNRLYHKSRTPLVGAIRGV